MNLSSKLLRLALILGLAWFGTAPLQAQENELLPPEQAFKLVAWMDGDRLIAEYTIAPGYYMYRERFAFEIESPAAKFGTALMPSGKLKYDEFFGEMETYRDRVRIELPIVWADKAQTRIPVRATGQGCADFGVCYPPLVQSLALNTDSNLRVYPVAYQAPVEQGASTANIEALQNLLGITPDLVAQQNPDLAAVGGSASILESLAAGSNATDEEIPHPDVAFKLSAKLAQDNSVQTHIVLYPNTYLYRDKFNVELVAGSGHSLGTVNLPSGDIKNDEFFGRMEVYHEQVKFDIPIVSSANASTEYSLAYQYQGCVEDRICYPPITKYLQVNTVTGSIDISDQRPQSVALQTGSSGVSQGAAPAGGDLAGLAQSEQDLFAQLLRDESLLLVIGLFFLAGIGLTFTPCVFPMIPILSSIIAGQGNTMNTRNAFSLSLAYVLAMATTYAVIGAIVGYYGAEYNIQIWFQDPVVLSAFAAVFVLLALSMFGFYEIQLPSALQTRLSAMSNNQQGGTVIGAGIMGFFSAIIVGPCITAPLVGALIFISQSQNWQLGGIALFALGLGMGLPLLLIGTSAGKLLPRAGGWMDSVKAVFGVVMLAMAIWLLERILPVSVTMALMAALIITSAIYMGALESLPSPVSGWRKLYKGVGIILLIYGSAYLLGAAAGSNDLIQPLKGVFASSAGAGSAGAEQRIVFRQIKGVQGLQQGVADSARQGRASMLDFYADWCISCKEMEKYAFTHPKVLAAMEQVTALQADVTANDAIDSELMNSLGIYGPPAILFFDASGEEIRHRRVVGEMSGEEFAAHVIATFK